MPPDPTTSDNTIFEKLEELRQRLHDIEADIRDIKRGDAK